MRKNNPERMTITEQLIAIKEDACEYACMFKEYLEDEIKDPELRKEKLRGYCERCPLTKLYFEGVSVGSNPEHPLGVIPQQTE